MVHGRVKADLQIFHASTLSGPLSRDFLKKILNVL
jgi:hypothetical protein